MARGDAPEELLWAAAKQGDAATVARLIEQGVDVNAPARYGATALTFASDRGHAAVVELLLKAGAHVDVRDTFYNARPIAWAAANNHPAVVTLLLKHGASGGAEILREAAAERNAPMVQAVLAGMDVPPELAAEAKALAEENAAPAPAERIAEVVKLLSAAAGDARVTEAAVPVEVLQSYVGEYQNARGLAVRIERDETRLMIRLGDAPPRPLRARDQTTFALQARDVTFQVRQGEVISLTLGTDARAVFERLAPGPIEAPPVDLETPPAVPPDEVTSCVHWPQFRGMGARGIGAGQRIPTVFDVPRRINVAWQTPIPGLGHASPVVWGEKVYLATCVGNENAGLRTGLYGDVDSVVEKSVHAWQVFCLDKATGRLVWLRTAITGVPAVKRHLKATHANCTPATDGRYVVAFFGSEGLHCYDVDGQLVWKKDLGKLDSGWFYDQDYQWGFGSSPIIFRDMVIVQCDIQRNSFITALDIASGKELWRTPRDEIPTWGTPTAYDGPGGPLLITNGTRAARAYDPLTGQERWRLPGQSEISVPTPFVARQLVYLASGYAPVKPITAIRLEAEGDLSAPSAAEQIAWSTKQGGPYLPTPLVYGDDLYVLDNNGALACYDALTGQRYYRRRVATAGGDSFTASPIAADGRLYLTSEEGRVFVVRTGRKFELLATNNVGEACLATPAISDGLLLIRTQKQLVAIGERPVEAPAVDE
jgi:outer membrane protein assembly factor BamB